MREEIPGGPTLATERDTDGNIPTVAHDARTRARSSSVTERSDSAAKAAVSCVAVGLSRRSCHALMPAVSWALGGRAVLATRSADVQLGYSNPE